MRKAFAGWIATAVIVFGLCAATTQARAQDIKIGALLALSGPSAYLGDPVQKALRLLVDNYNAKGGMAGRKVRVVVYDTEASTGKAVQLYRRLVENDGVQVVIGPSTTGETLALKPLANEMQVPVISFGARADIVVPPEPYMFKVSPTDDIEIRQLVVDLAAKNIKRIGVIWASGGYGQGGAELLKQHAPSAGATVVADEQFQPLDTDMTSQLLRLREAKTDGLVIWATDPGATLVVKQAVALGFGKPIINSPAVADPKFLSNVGPAVNGTYVQSSRLLVADQLPPNDPQRAGLLWLTDAYRKMFKEDPPQNAGHPYDALLLIEQAITGTTGPLTGTIVQKGLEHAKVCGANGCFTMTPQDHNGLPADCMVLLKAVNGTWRLDQ